MRSYQTIINQARFLVSPTEIVENFLEQRAARLKKDRFEDEGDEEFETALLSRNDALINLALARFCRHESTAQALLTGSQGSDIQSQAIRLSVLSNETLAGGPFAYFPKRLFGGKEQLAAWLSKTGDEEIVVLFNNPQLDDSFLTDFLEGDECWQAMSEKGRFAALSALSSNKRMKSAYDSSYMDGYAEYSYGAVFSAAWKLAETAPTTPQWARTLCWLYDQLQKDAFSIKNPLELAARWFPDPADAELSKQEREEVERGYLSHYQGVRKGLGMLALETKSSLAELLASADPAFRSAAYAAGDLTPEQIAAAYDKDGELAFNQAAHNRSLWRRAPTRQALHDIAWAIVKNDKHSDLMAANIYNGIKDNITKEHPDWFHDDEEYNPEPADKPATKEDLQQLADQLATPNTNGSALEQVKQSIQTLNSRIGWVWWFSLGALVASFKHF